MAINYSQYVSRPKTTNYPAPAASGRSVPQGYAPASYQGRAVLGAAPSILGSSSTLPVQQEAPANRIINNSPITGGGSNTVDTSAINAGVNTGFENLERDYQDALAQADTAEAGLRGQASQATSELQGQGQQVKSALENQRLTAEQGIGSQERTAQTQAKSAMQQARDLFRQQQQQNIAQLSGLGLSSSSVMEGLAEKLGVETARRIGGVTGSLNEVLQNLSAERARVNDYAKTKTTELEQNLQTQIGGIQQQLLQGIRQIQDSRQMASTAKANARANLMQQAQAQIGALQANAQQFAQQMQQWALQKSAVLTDAAKGFTINPTDMSGLQGAISNVQSIRDASGQPLSYDIQAGPTTGFYRVLPKTAVKPFDTTEEEL